MEVASMEIHTQQLHRLTRPPERHPLAGRPTLRFSLRPSRGSLTYLTVLSVHVTLSRNIGFFNKSQSCCQNSNRQQRFCILDFTVFSL